MDKMAKSKHMDLGIPTDLKNLTRNLGIVPRAPILQEVKSCHAAGRGLIPGRDRFPGLSFFDVFPHL